MTTIIVRKKICIDPKYLDHKVKEHVLKVSQNTTMESECTEEFGYVLSVNRIVKIYDFRMSSATAKCVIDLDMEITAIKPIVGEEIQGTICMFTTAGVFVDFHGKFQTLIPKTKLGGFTMGDNCIEKNNGPDEEYIKHKVGDKIMVLFTTVDYNKDSLFSSCGELV